MNSAEDFYRETAADIAAEERASGRRWGRDVVQASGGACDDTEPTPTSLVTMTSAVQAWRDGLLREQDMPRLRTGYERLDRATKGVQPGELIGILARTGSGKTLLTDEIVSAWVRQRPASAFVVANLEMPCAQLVGRMMRKHFRRTEDSIEQDARADRLDVAKVVQTFQNLYFIDRGAVTLDYIRREAEDLARTIAPAPIDAIVIDHSGLVRVTRGTSAYERASSTAIEAKQLARELRTVVLLVIQANRAGKQDVEPVPLESARDSGAYEENCDFLVTMGQIVHAPAQPSQVKCRLAKNRRGPTVPFTLTFDPVSLRLRELDAQHG